MGSAISEHIDKTLGHDKKDILNDYIPLRKITDRRFGEVRIMQHIRSKEQFVCKELLLPSKSEFRQIYKQWHQRLQMQNMNLIQLIGISYRAEENFCSTYYKIFLIFDLIKSDLEEELAVATSQAYYNLSLMSTQQTSDENTFNLFFLLDSLLNALCYLQSLGICHGELKPNTIYVSNKGYKIADHILFNQMPNYKHVFMSHDYAQGHLYDTKNIYLSPQLIKCLENKLEQPIHDPYKSDIFTVAMIILHAGLLRNCDDCYDYKNFVIKEDIIKERLNLLLKYHGEILYTLLEFMLEFDETSRLDYFALLDKLRENTTYEIKEFIKKKRMNIESKPLARRETLNNRTAAHLKNESYQSIVLDRFEKTNYDIEKRSNNEVAASVFPGGRKTSTLDLNLRRKASVISNIDFENVNEEYGDGSRYEGEKKRGKKHGRGKFFFKDKSYYDGQWRDGVKNGRGTLHYPNGKICYQGDWRDDKFHGYGILYNEHQRPFVTKFDYTNFDLIGEYWEKYEGDFKNDKKEGFGILILTNGEKFSGKFIDDLVHGKGTFHDKEKQIISGFWERNKLVS